MSPIHKTNYTWKSIPWKDILLIYFEISPLDRTIFWINLYLQWVYLWHRWYMYNELCRRCSLYFYQIVTLCRTISVSSLVFFSYAVKHFEIDGKLIFCKVLILFYIDVYDVIKSFCMVKTCMYSGERVACTCTDLNRGGGGSWGPDPPPPAKSKFL